jgi:hypothetical protein
MARSEVMLASKLKPLKVSDFPSTQALKAHLVQCIAERRMGRQKGIITEMTAGGFDPDADFIKIGRGSLGGKARGLAFISTLLKQHPEIQARYKDVDIRIPKTVAVSTEGFDAFIGETASPNSRHARRTTRRSPPPAWPPASRIGSPRAFRFSWSTRPARWPYARRACSRMPSSSRLPGSTAPSCSPTTTPTPPCAWRG